MSDRWRCLQVGCNPVLEKESAEAHRNLAGHRVAKWPTRSAAGEAKAQARNRSGYYRKYNTGDKSPAERGIRGYDYADSIHPFSEEAFE